MGLFTKKTTFSIEFRADEIRVVEGRYNKKNIIVNKCFTIPVPEGIYEDGVIKDTEKFTHTLQQGLSKNHVSRGSAYGDNHIDL